MLTDLAHLMVPSVAQNMDAASRPENTRITTWTHLVRERGNLETTKDVLVKMNRGRLSRRAADQMSEYLDRAKPKSAFPQSRPSSSQNQAWSRPNSQKIQGGSEWDQKAWNNSQRGEVGQTTAIAFQI